MILSFKEYLLTGKIEGVGLGYQRSEIIDAFGEPSDWYGMEKLECSESPCWFFNDHLQIVFDRTSGLVNGYSVCFETENAEPIIFNDGLSKYSTLELFLEYIELNGIRYEREDDRTGQLLIWTGPQTSAVFSGFKKLETIDPDGWYLNMVRGVDWVKKRHVR